MNQLLFDYHLVVSPVTHIQFLLNINEMLWFEKYSVLVVAFIYCVVKIRYNNVLLLFIVLVVDFSQM